MISSPSGFSSLSGFDNDVIVWDSIVSSVGSLSSFGSSFSGFSSSLLIDGVLWLFLPFFFFLWDSPSFSLGSSGSFSFLSDVDTIVSSVPSGFFNSSSFESNTCSTPDDGTPSVSSGFLDSGLFNSSSLLSNTCSIPEEGTPSVSSGFLDSGLFNSSSLLSNTCSAPDDGTPSVSSGFLESSGSSSFSSFGACLELFFPFLFFLLFPLVSPLPFGSSDSLGSSLSLDTSVSLGSSSSLGSFLSLVSSFVSGFTSSGTLVSLGSSTLLNKTLSVFGSSLVSVSGTVFGVSSFCESSLFPPSSLDFFFLCFFFFLPMVSKWICNKLIPLVIELINLI